MAGSPLHPENFGFFASSPKTKARVTDPTCAATVDRLESVLAKKLAQISEREGEDAVLTGGTRSLSRRLLALNMTEHHGQPLSQQRRALSA